MKKQIVIDKNVRQILMKTFGCSRVMVWRALHYAANSDTARRIRKVALQKGGKRVGGRVPECETTHEEVEETMTQCFGRRVKLVLHKPTCEVTVYVDGEVCRRETVADIPALMTLQRDVELMAASL